MFMLTLSLIKKRGPLVTFGNFSNRLRDGILALLDKVKVQLKKIQLLQSELF